MTVSSVSSSAPNSPFPTYDDGTRDGPNIYDFDLEDSQDLTPKEIRGIKWRGREYILKQASADAVIKYNNARFRQARMDDGKLCGVAGGAELPSLLVGMCLFEILIRADKIEQHKPLNDSIVRATFKHHQIDKLFEDAKRISHIDVDNRTTLQKIHDLEKQLSKLRQEYAREQGILPGTEQLVEISGSDSIPNSTSNLGSGQDSSSTKTDKVEDLVGNS